VCGTVHFQHYDHTRRWIRDLSNGDTRIYLEVEIRRVACRRCGKVKREQLPWIANPLHYTKRFALVVGRRCRSSPVLQVAKEYHLDWHTVKDLDKQYMEEQLKRCGRPAPRVIGLDEISHGRGARYRIVVSDLGRNRAIWFGGVDRSEESLDLFYKSLTEKEKRKIRLAVMDMWKAFENSTRKHVPQAAILYDKFHVMRHAGEAVDTVRKQEYRRLKGPRRKYLKGQKYILLSRREHLNLEGRRALRKIFRLNKRLQTAYLLRESLGCLWDYHREAWARKFFENWKASLQGQNLKPFEKVARMIEKHWDGIAAYCRPENKVSLGFVEGLNNKIRVIQRRAYGLRDEDYLRLKILTCTLPEL